MGQEFIIKSQQLEDKINQLLPSQGGFQAGVDLSASTTVIPIVDLTESAEGSNLRQDLQSAIDINSTVFDVNNASNTTIVNTPGYFRLRGLISTTTTQSGDTLQIQITDGATTKTILNGKQVLEISAVGTTAPTFFDIIVKLNAGDTLRATATGAALRISGTAKQLADINGNLT